VSDVRQLCIPVDFLYHPCFTGKQEGAEASQTLRQHSHYSLSNLRVRHIPEFPVACARLCLAVGVDGHLRTQEPGGGTASGTINDGRFRVDEDIESRCPPLSLLISADLSHVRFPRQWPRHASSCKGVCLFGILGCWVVACFCFWRRNRDD
jgi:hypothetical protein